MADIVQECLSMNYRAASDRARIGREAAAEIERLRAALATITECSTDDTAIICARAALEGAPLFSPAALAQEKQDGTIIGRELGEDWA
jgi:hypothetical protein